jgi:hypothetical protein
MEREKGAPKESGSLLLWSKKRANKNDFICIFVERTWRYHTKRQH